MTDKQSIADWIGLLYQDRKLIDFLLVQSKERMLFSKEELLPFCRNNPERFQRLLDQDFLKRKGGSYTLSVRLLQFLGSDKISLSPDSYVQLLIERLDKLLEENSAQISEWKSYMYQVEESCLKRAEELSIERDKNEIAQFQEQIRELRIRLLDEKMNVILNAELEILYLELRQSLKALEQSMQRIGKGFDLPFNHKLRSIKNIDITALRRKQELEELLEKLPSLFLDQAVLVKPRISSADLEAEEALHTLAKNLR